MIYTKSNGVVIDSIDMRKKLIELKQQDNSEERSKEVKELFHLMQETPPCH